MLLHGFVVLPLLMLWFTFASGQTASERLEARLADIEQAHATEPWRVSQGLIEQIRPEQPGLSPDQRARLDLMEVRNFALRGMYEECTRAADEVLARPVELGRRLRALQLATNCSLHFDRFEAGFGYLAAALRLLPETDDLIPKADILSLAARMHWEVGELAVALTYAAESLELARHSEDANTICDSLYTLASAQFEAALLMPALQSSEEAWMQCQQDGDPVMIGGSMELIGRVLIGLGRYQEAIGWLRRAIEAYTEFPYESGLGLARFQLAVALIESGNATEGLELLAAVEPMVGWVYGVSETEFANVRARAYAANGEWASALQQLGRVRTLLTEDDSIRTRRFAYLQAEFEAQRREQEISLLREQNRVLQLAEEANAKRVRIQWVVGLSTAIVALLLIGLLVSFRLDRRRFRRLSQYDGLTGLYNHRSFHQEVQAALRRLGAKNAPAVLVAADVDLFKKINDRYGHQAGDRVLKHLGEVLREQFPPPCLLGRIGGEEFGIFIPEQNRLQVRQRIHALRSGLGKVDFQGRTMEFTLSFGLIESRGNARLETMRRRADEALYRAKRSGRDELIDAADLDQA